MARIIENLEQKLIAEALQQMRTEGCSAVSIRGVARGCGVGVGTVYNYFPSKEALLTACIMSQWQERVEIFQEASRTAETPREALFAIYTQMQLFGTQHQALLSSPEATGAISAPGSPYNMLLRGQIAQSIRRFCGSDFAAEFIAQAFFGSVMVGQPFEESYSMLKKLF